MPVFPYDTISLYRLLRIPYLSFITCIFSIPCVGRISCTELAKSVQPRHIYFSQYQGTPATHSIEHTHESYPLQSSRSSVVGKMEEIGASLWVKRQAVRCRSAFPWTRNPRKRRGQPVCGNPYRRRERVPRAERSGLREAVRQRIHPRRGIL